MRVSVRDTGIGFDGADANRMTECFARALTAEAARIPGLGIGLYLANEIVKLPQRAAVAREPPRRGHAGAPRAAARPKRSDRGSPAASRWSSGAELRRAATPAADGGERAPSARATSAPARPEHAAAVSAATRAGSARQRAAPCAERTHGREAGRADAAPRTGRCAMDGRRGQDCEPQGERVGGAASAEPATATPAVECETPCRSCRGRAPTRRARARDPWSAPRGRGRGARCASCTNAVPAIAKPAVTCVST